jgi:hypothetical protein
MTKPSIFLKIIFQNTGKVQSIRSRKSKRIFHYIQREELSGCLFEVSVTYAKGIKNETWSQRKDEVIKTLKAFLEE